MLRRPTQFNKKHAPTITGGINFYNLFKKSCSGDDCCQYKLENKSVQRTSSQPNDTKNTLNEEGQGNEGTAAVAPYHNSAQARGHAGIRVAIEARRRPTRHKNTNLTQQSEDSQRTSRVSEKETEIDAGVMGLREQANVHKLARGPRRSLASIDGR